MIPQTQSNSEYRPQINLPLGRLLSTPGALDALTKAGQDGSTFLHRHQSGDWGEVGPQDWAANDQAVRD